MRHDHARQSEQVQTVTDDAEQAHERYDTSVEDLLDETVGGRRWCNVRPQSADSRRRLCRIGEQRTHDGGSVERIADQERRRRVVFADGVRRPPAGRQRRCRRRQRGVVWLNEETTQKAAAADEPLQVLELCRRSSSALHIVGGAAKYPKKRDSDVTRTRHGLDRKTSQLVHVNRKDSRMSSTCIRVWHACYLLLAV